LRSNSSYGKNDSVKGLVLSSVFIECYLPELDLTVSELLAAHPILNGHYGLRPHVLSNVLRRYKIQGLLYRWEEYVRGHPCRYNLTEKGFNRLDWMSRNSTRYLFCGKDLVSSLTQAGAFVHVWGKRQLEDQLRNERKLMGELAEAGRVPDFYEIGLIVQSMEKSLKADYGEAKVSEILATLREDAKCIAKSLAEGGSQ
jgi:hypothetical protein